MLYISHKNNRFGSTPLKSSWCLNKYPVRTSSHQQGQHCLYNNTQKVCWWHVLSSTASVNSFSSSMTVSSSSQQISTVADREICSPGCAATVIDWTWVCGKNIYRSRWALLLPQVPVVVNICPAIRYKYYLHMYNTMRDANLH